MAGVDRSVVSLGRYGETARPVCEAGRVRVVAGVADMPGAFAWSGAGRRPCPLPFGSRFRRFRATRARGAWQAAWFPLVAGLALLFSAGAAPALADTTPPTPSGNVALLSGQTVEQVFDEYLDMNSVPDKSAFRITADGVNVAVISVSVVRRFDTGAVVLTVSSLILHGAFRFTVAYSPPAANPLQDEAGNDVAAYAVTYGSPGPPPPPPGGGGGGFGGGGGGGGARAPASPGNLTAEAGDGEVVLSWDAPEDDGGSAITDYEYRNVGRDPWTSTGSSDTTYTVSGLDNGVTYAFEVRAVNRSGKSFPSKRVEATPEAPQVFTLDFPHFANGGGISSEVVLLNVGASPIRPVLYFSDRQGKPIAAGSVVEVTDDLEIQQNDGGLTLRTAIEPLGELTVATHGRGAEVSGSVRVASEGAPLGGVLRYSVPGVGVTGVGTGLAVRDALFPARRKQGGIRTAAALHNPGEEAIELTCWLMSGGEVLEEAKIRLEANGQRSWFLENEFPMTDTREFVGTVRCTAPGEGEYMGLAVEVDAANRIFTTLPVAAVERRAGEGGPTVLHFAHFANGGNPAGEGIRSELVFVNVQTEASRSAPTPFHRDIPASRPVIYFYDQQGRMIDPESVVDLTDDLEVTDEDGLTIKAEMAPLGELTIATHGRGEEVSGSVKVESEGAIGGVLRYRVPGVGVTGVGAGPAVVDALFPARRREGGIRTAAALRNLGEEAMEVTCWLMSGGAVLEGTTISLEPNGQTSWFIEDEFTATDTTDFAGTVRCTAPGEGSEEKRFTGLAVEVDAANRIFTTLPVVPLGEAMPRE